MTEEIKKEEVSATKEDSTATTSTGTGTGGDCESGTGKCIFSCFKEGMSSKNALLHVAAAVALSLVAVTVYKKFNGQN